MCHSRLTNFRLPGCAAAAPLCALLALAAGCSTEAQRSAGPAPSVSVISPRETAASPENKTVLIRISLDFGGEVAGQRREVKWRDGMTVLDALLALEASGIVVQHRGQGSRAFVESVNGVKNSGAGPNWLFYVNDKKADRGAGVFPLQKGDVVLWKYTAEK